MFGHIGGQVGFDPDDPARRRAEAKRRIICLHPNNQRPTLLDRREIVSARLLPAKSEQTGGKKPDAQQARILMADTHAVLLARLTEVGIDRRANIRRDPTAMPTPPAPLPRS